MEKKFIFDDKTAIVETEKGKVRGYFYDDMYIFKGIPYAKAKRFHAPEPADAWDDVMTTINYGHVCPLLDDPQPESAHLDAGSVRGETPCHGMAARRRILCRFFYRADCL